MLEPEPPEVVVDHWLPILWEHGNLVECHPDQFTAMADWVPLYTPEGLQKHLPAVLSTFVNTGPPSLTVMVPLEIHMGQGVPLDKFPLALVPDEAVN